MELRESTYEDIQDIMRIIAQAQQYFKENNIDQWQNNYPNSEVIAQDIAEGHSYVLENEGEIIATAALSFDGESTYEKIYEGSWIKDEDYAVVHRIAVDNKYKGQGIAGKLFEMMEELCLKQGVASIKIDTHEDNKSMQKLLQKCDFVYCGVIYLGDESKRVAFQK